MRFFSPRIFISYAREDAVFATALGDVLAKHHFVVFIDTQEIGGGEDFISRIDNELRDSDAMVALHTDNSITSDWCRAEWYAAYTRRIPVIAVRIGALSAILPEPLRLRDQRLHAVAAGNAEEFAQASEAIAHRLRTIFRMRRILAWTLVATLVAISAYLLMPAVQSVFLETPSLEQAAPNSHAVLAAINDSHVPLDRNRVRIAAKLNAEDDVLLQRVSAIASDSSRSVSARQNALKFILLALGFRNGNRILLRDFSWEGGAVDGTAVADVTFGRGTVQSFTIRNATLAGVYWLAETTVRQTTFDNVKFNSGAFAANLINVEFVDCVFRGAELDITNFTDAKFRTSPNVSQVITARVGAFENSVISRRTSTVDSGVLDLSSPPNIAFQGIVFTGVRFRGSFDPAWFKDCSFDRCTLPRSLTSESLERAGNRVTDATFTDESLD